MRDAFDFLLLRHIGDALDQKSLVHLIRDFVDDYCFPIIAKGLDARFRADSDGAAAGDVSLCAANFSVDDSAGRKIRRRDVFHQPFDRNVRLFDHRKGRVYKFAQIVGRNVCSHSDGNSAAPVYKQVWKARRKNYGLAILPVVVVLEIDGFSINVGEQHLRDLGHSNFGVSHGRRIIAVH